MERSPKRLFRTSFHVLPNDLKNMTKYGTIKQMEKVNWITNILLEICAKR